MYAILFPDMDVEQRLKYAEHHCIVASQFLTNSATFKEVRLFVQYKKGEMMNQTLQEVGYNRNRIKNRNSGFGWNVFEIC